MKTNGILISGCAWFCALTAALAGAGSTAAKSLVAPTPTDQTTQLDVLTMDASYVFSSPIKFAHQRVGTGDEVHTRFQYLRRVPLSGNWFFQAGVNYERFDFGGSSTGAPGPLPGGLQELSAPIGITYLVNNEIGFLAQMRPGVYFEHNINSGAFDVPIELGGIYPIEDKKLYLVYGLTTSFLREYPVLPELGLVWLINPNMKLLGVLPEPKFIYTCSDRFAWWVGGELLMESYKTDNNTNVVFSGNDKTTSGSVVDYTEYRVGLGATYTPVKGWDFNVAAGYALDRSFSFYRADKTYHADPAPFVRLELKASF